MQAGLSTELAVGGFKATALRFLPGAGGLKAYDSSLCEGISLLDPKVLPLYVSELTG